MTDEIFVRSDKQNLIINASRRNSPLQNNRTIGFNSVRNRLEYFWLRILGEVVSGGIEDDAVGS